MIDHHSYRAGVTRPRPDQRRGLSLSVHTLGSPAVGRATGRGRLASSSPHVVPAKGDSSSLRTIARWAGCRTRGWQCQAKGWAERRVTPRTRSCGSGTPAPSAEAGSQRGSDRAPVRPGVPDRTGRRQPGRRPTSRRTARLKGGGLAPGRGRSRLPLFPGQGSAETSARKGGASRCFPRSGWKGS